MPPVEAPGATGELRGPRSFRHSLAGCQPATNLPHGFAELGGLLLEGFAGHPLLLPLCQDGAGTGAADDGCRVAPKHTRVLLGSQVQHRVRVLHGKAGLLLCRFAGLLQLLLSPHPDLLVHSLLYFSLEASQACCLLPLLLLQLLLNSKC